MLPRTSAACGLCTMGCARTPRLAPSMAQLCWNLRFRILMAAMVSTPLEEGSWEEYQGSSITPGLGEGRNFWRSASAKDPSKLAGVLMR